MPDSKLSVPQTYPALRQAVERVMVKGQQAIERAKVQTYWDTGRLIGQYLLLNKGRAEYGTSAVQRLATDLKLDVSVLQRCARFAETFPIVATWPQLTWAHYRLLIPIEDPKQRRALAGEANRNQWTIVQLEQRIRAVIPLPGETEPAVPSGGEAPKPLVPRRGTPGVCKVIDRGDGVPVVDLGFASYLDLSTDTGMEVGDFVRARGSGWAKATDATKADLFTYRAAILKLVDGDTLWVRIYLRPGQWVKQKLRLRDLDCPEMSTVEGKAARRFVERLLATASPEIVLCTTKPDKYDRYLADVFLSVQSARGEGQSGEEIFLNNALFSNGHAMLKKAWEFADWGE